MLTRQRQGEFFSQVLMTPILRQKFRKRKKALTVIARPVVRLQRS
jgi:hypothetical protein